MDMNMHVIHTHYIIEGNTSKRVQNSKLSYFKIEREKDKEGTNGGGEGEGERGGR